MPNQEKSRKEVLTGYYQYYFEDFNSDGMKRELLIREAEAKGLTLEEAILYHINSSVNRALEYESRTGKSAIAPIIDDKQYRTTFGHLWDFYNSDTLDKDTKDAVARTMVALTERQSEIGGDITQVAQTITRDLEATTTEALVAKYNTIDSTLNNLYGNIFKHTGSVHDCYRENGEQIKDTVFSKQQITIIHRASTTGKSDK